MRHTSPTSMNVSMGIFFKKADLNAEIKRCGIRAMIAESPEEKMAAIVHMDNLFSKALTDGLVGAHTYCVMIHALGQAGEINRALTLYHEVWDKNCFIHAAILKALRENDQFPALFNIYCELIRLNAETDPHIFSIVISAARKNNQLDFARRVYQDASDRNQINNYIIRAYGNIDKLLRLPLAAAFSAQPAQHSVEQLGATDLHAANRVSALARAFLFPFAEARLPPYSESVAGSTLRK